MIDIISINPTGYFSYGRHDTIILEHRGLVLLEGCNDDRHHASNGSGKTSIFNALTHILFGKNPTGHFGEAILNRQIGKCFGIVKFRTDAGLWRIIEVRKWKRTDNPPDASVNENSLWVNNGDAYYGTDLFLERWDDGLSVWVDERATNISTGNTRLDMKATRKKILDILEISYDQFMSVAYLAQQQSLKFLTGGHKERMEMLSEITDLSVWNKRIDKIKEDLSQTNSNIQTLIGVVGGMEAASTRLLPPTQEEISASEAAIIECDASIAQSDVRLTNLVLAKDSATREANNLSKDNEYLNTTIRSLSDMQAQLQALKSEEFVKHVAKLDKAKNATRPTIIDDLEQQLVLLDTTLSIRREELSQLMLGAGRCSKCRTTVTADHLQRHRSLLTVDIQKLKIERDTVKGNLDTATAEHNNSVSQIILEAEAEWNKISSTIDNDIANYRELVQQQYMILSSNNDKIKQLQSSSYQDAIDSEYQTRLGALSRRATSAQARAALATRERESAEHVGAISAARSQLADARSKARYLTVLERMFGDKGMKAQRLDSALHAINLLLNDSIKDISDGSVSAYVTKTREKADGDQTTDISVIIKDGTKDDVAYELYSGGEKQQIVLAFVTAFWLLATKYGTGVNILCLDEIFGPLDNTNASNMFNFLEKMGRMGKSSIFVVTHNSDIKNAMKFDQIWTVRKTNDVSKLEIQ